MRRGKTMTEEKIAARRAEVIEAARAFRDADTAFAATEFDERPLRESRNADVRRTANIRYDGRALDMQHAVMELRLALDRLGAAEREARAEDGGA